MTSPATIRSLSSPVPALRNSAFFTCLVAASLALFGSGCLRNKVHAAPIVVPSVPPAPIAAPVTIKSPASIPAPALLASQNPEFEAFPVALIPKTNALRRPVTTESEPERPAAPQISPQLSSSDQSELTKQTQQFVADAQENLHRADGRDLNPNQLDMVGKIRGFLDQAQDAIRTSDWARAKNLSQKAYLLSLDLVKTL